MFCNPVLWRMLEWTRLPEYLRKARLVIKMHSGSPVGRQATSKLRLHDHNRFETVNIAYEILNRLYTEWQIDVWSANTGLARSQVNTFEILGSPTEITTARLTIGSPRHTCFSLYMLTPIQISLHLCHKAHKTLTLSFLHVRDGRLLLPQPPLRVIDVRTRDLHVSCFSNSLIFMGAVCQLPSQPSIWRTEELTSPFKLFRMAGDSIRSPTRLQLTFSRGH